MPIHIAIVLGIVEGLTEFLPVSSTGHLILMGHWLGETGDHAKTFDIVVQLGAVMAVVVYYRRLLATRVRGLLQRDPLALRLFGALLIAFVPAGVLGLTLGKWIKEHLFGPMPVAGALLVGGLLMIVMEGWRSRRGIEGDSGHEQVTLRRAFLIGIGQSFALWPGASRSMCTILAGQLGGLSTRTAAEFSFLLSIPTLGAATIYEAFKARRELWSGGGALPLAVGLVVSFIVAWLVIAGFLRYLERRGLAPFGYYRIGLAVLVFAVSSS